MIRVSTNNLYQSSVQGIMADQSAVYTSVANLSSGKQINSPADNPVGAAQASLLQSDITQLAQFTTNQGQASQLLNNASSTLTRAINVVQSAQTTLVQAGGGTLNDTNRLALAAQLQQNLNELVGLANTGDAQGGYLFGGSVTSTPPFVQNGNTVTYAGDGIAQGVAISNTRTEQVKYPGSGIFMSIPAGNGSFSTAAAGNTQTNGSNQGSGVIGNTSVTSPSALTGDSYTISLDASNQYTVTNTSTTPPTTVLGPTAYSDPTTLAFDGMQMTLSGTVMPFDTFKVTPAGTESIFHMLASAISALQTPSGSAASNAQRSSDVTTALGNMGQALTSLTTTQSAMGAQLQELNTYATMNSDRTLQDQTQISSLVDLNYAKGASALAQQQTQYQAALQSYSAVSKLSLFNYM